LAEESGATTSYDFFKSYMVDLYEIIYEMGIESIEGFAEENLTNQQQEVMEILTNELDGLELPIESAQFAQMIAITYLLKERPSFRKTEVIAAAIFKVAYDCDALGFYDFTQ